MDARTVLVSLLAALSLMTASNSQGQWLPNVADLSISSSLVGAWRSHGNGYYGTLGARKYINSFTSYQFPNLSGTQDPLSRLEFPWEQVLGVVKVGYASQSFDLDFSYASTALSFTGLKAQDSDWQDPNNPNQKTTFSESKAKPRVWTFDTSVAVPAPGAPGIKGVVGFRAQQFKFTPTDALERSIWIDGVGYVPVYWKYLPGEDAQISQHYYHWYGGGVLTGAMDLGTLYGPLPDFQLIARFQGDYGYVRGSNQDFHLLHGNRHTYETTTGHSWHLNLVAEFRVINRFALSLEGDFIRAWTKGSHQLTDSGDATNLSWDGAKVWSDQKYIAVNGSVSF